MRPGRCILPVGMFELRPHGIALQHHAEDAAEPGLAVGLDAVSRIVLPLAQMVSPAGIALMNVP